MSWLTVGLYRKSDYSPSNLHLTVYLNQHRRTFDVPNARHRTRIRLTISSRESWYFFSHESVSRLTVRRSASSIRENISLAKKKLLGKERSNFEASISVESFRSFLLILDLSLTRTRTENFRNACRIIFEKKRERECFHDHAIT